MVDKASNKDWQWSKFGEVYTSNKFWVPQQDITALGPTVTLESKIFKYFTEVYRSGHNGPDSKSGIRQRIVGSNPTASAMKKGAF